LLSRHTSSFFSPLVHQEKQRLLQESIAVAGMVLFYNVVLSGQEEQLGKRLLEMKKHPFP
jgi:hypothetical protein